MLDYRLSKAIADDRLSELRRERRRQALTEQIHDQPEPRRGGRRRWSVADFVGLLVPKRDAR